MTFSGAASASFTINSDTQLTATVPVTAHTGVITVSNCPGSATSGTFTVVKTSKKLSCIVPNVVGMRLVYAESKIVHKHCSVGTETKSPLHRLPRWFWYVTAQHPAHGKKRPNGAAVSLKAVAKPLR